MCPGFLAPPFMDYSGYHRYIDEHLPSENPSLYGLHPNIELECLTVTSNNVMRTLLELQPQDLCGAEGEAQSKEEKVCRQNESLMGKNWSTYRNNFTMFIVYVRSSLSSKTSSKSFLRSITWPR